MGKFGPSRWPPVAWDMTGACLGPLILGSRPDALFPGLRVRSPESWDRIDRSGSPVCEMIERQCHATFLLTTRKEV